eukprot:4206160-Pleurochrysis_carterae.AAC.1
MAVLARVASEAVAVASASAASAATSVVMAASAATAALHRPIGVASGGNAGGMEVRMNSRSLIIFMRFTCSRTAERTTACIARSGLRDFEWRAKQQARNRTVLRCETGRCWGKGTEGREEEEARVGKEWRGS